MRIFYLFLCLFLFSASSFAYHKNQIVNDNNRYSVDSGHTGESKAVINEISRGEMLYTNHCQVCHESNVHVREHRKAKSIVDIIGWVTRWSSHLKLDWNIDDINEVAYFLNEKYYKVEIENP